MHAKTEKTGSKGATLKNDLSTGYFGRLAALRDARAG